MLHVRNPMLEAAMLEAREDPRPALVYADWLQANGSAWGELITVQHALETRPDDAALLSRERALVSALPLPPADFGTVSWRRGCIEALHVFNERDWMDSAFDVMEVVRPVLALPMCAGLRELRTGVIRWEANRVDVPAVLDEVAKHDFVGRVERLMLGDIPDDVDMDHHVIGDVRAALKRFAGLRWLTLHSGAQAWESPDGFEFGPLTLPALEVLRIETCAMTAPRLRQVLDSHLPALRSLTLWFGAPDRDGDARLEDLRPLLAGRVLGTVTALGLCNNEFTDALAVALCDSVLPERLTSLDLSMGTLGGDGARTLADAAARWPRLTRLDVSQSFLDEDDVARLRQAFPRATVVADDMKEPVDEDRYCSVHE
ncbi:MAG: hypothetical protein ACOZQL_18320 [Myxococcota bacterium]